MFKMTSWTVIYTLAYYTHTIQIYICYTYILYYCTVLFTSYMYIWIICLQNLVRCHGMWRSRRENNMLCGGLENWCVESSLPPPPLRWVFATLSSSRNQHHHHHHQTVASTIKYNKYSYICIYRISSLLCTCWRIVL